MASLSLLCDTLGIDAKRLTREEALILEAELFLRIYQEIEGKLKAEYKEYFRLMKFNEEMEKTMIESNFIRCLIDDLLRTENYTLPGIALYTQMPEDVISELVSGCNLSPTLSLPRKIIELHRRARPEIYQEVMKKITSELVTVI